MMAGSSLRPPVATDTVQLIGNLGQILFDGVRLVLYDLDGERETQVFDRDATYQSAFDGAIRHFVERLQSGQSFETSLPDNLLTLRLVDDAYRFAEGYAG